MEAQANNRLKGVLIWIALILTLAALRETRPVTMPLGLGLFIAVLAWPLEKRLERKMPAWASLTITSLVFLGVLAGFVTALVLCATVIADKATDYQELFTGQVAMAKNWLQQRGMPAEYLRLDPNATLERAVSVLLDFATGLYSLLGQLLLATGYSFLALLEMRAVRDRVRDAHVGTAHLVISPEWLAAGREIVAGTKTFMLTRTAIGVAIAVLTVIFTWLIGLDFALVWGVSAFLLNYVPLFGAVVAVILPTLLAIIQPEAAWLAPVTFIGLSAIHVGLGNYLDPWMQGRYLALSPLLLFFAITFWGWVWGVAGVLMSVPLTAALVICCKHFERTRWIAALLARPSGHAVPMTAPGLPGTRNSGPPASPAPAPPSQATAKSP